MNVDDLGSKEPTMAESEGRGVPHTTEENAGAVLSVSVPDAATDLVQIKHPASGLSDRSRVSVPIEYLQPHPHNNELFPPASAEKDKELASSLLHRGLHRPLVITGDGCASAPGTVLCGNRRLHFSGPAGLQSLECEVRVGLSVEEEHYEMIVDNLSDHASRDLNEEQLFELEQLVAKEHERRQGQRNDLVPQATKGSTLELVARKTKQPINRVRTRKKVFASPVSTPELKADVNAKTIAPTRAAEVITEVSKEFKITKDSSEEEVAMARAAVNERYKAPRAAGARRRTTRGKKTEPRCEPKREALSAADSEVSVEGLPVDYVWPALLGTSVSQEYAAREFDASELTPGARAAKMCSCIEAVHPPLKELFKEIKLELFPVGKQGALLTESHRKYRRLVDTVGPFFLALRELEALLQSKLPS